MYHVVEFQIITIYVHVIKHVLKMMRLDVNVNAAGLEALEVRQSGRADNTYPRHVEPQPSLINQNDYYLHKKLLRVVDNIILIMKI